MKGEIFVDFAKMIGERYGLIVADQLLSDPALDSKGAYTRVGTYDHAEMIHLVVSLANLKNVDPALLQREFGRYLFSCLASAHMEFVENYKSTFDLILSIENAIHVNVRKLYPDASLPTIDTVRLDDRTIRLKYSSERGFGHVCHGLIEGCIAYYGEDIAVEREDISQGPLDKTCTFRLIKNETAR